MKTTLTLHPQLMRDNWFRAMPPAIRLFWLHLLTESDTAGWWQPDWDVCAAWLKLPEPLKPLEVQALLEKEGQIKVHPSGWWELTQYRAQQYPNGLSPEAPYHKSVLKVLNAHLKREAAFTSPTPSVDPAQKQGSDPAGPQGQGGGPNADTSAGLAGMDAASIKSHSKDPGPGHGPKAQDPARAQDQATAPTGGLGGGDPTGYEGPAREAAVAALQLHLDQRGIDVHTEGLPEALGGLVDGLGLTRAMAHVKAGLAASKRPTAASLMAWLTDRVAGCAHPEARLKWWTAHVAGGLLQKHWRCLDCGAHQRHGDPYLGSSDGDGHGVAT